MSSEREHLLSVKVPPGALSTYLPLTEFADPNPDGYDVEVTSEGVRVYSECCASWMSRETAVKLYAALGEYLRDAQ